MNQIADVQRGAVQARISVHPATPKVPWWKGWAPFVVSPWLALLSAPSNLPRWELNVDAGNSHLPTTNRG
jgi:hypothetical protein